MPLVSMPSTGYAPGVWASSILHTHLKCLHSLMIGGVSNPRSTNLVRSLARVMLCDIGEQTALLRAAL